MLDSLVSQDVLVPERSLTQRMDALKSANEIRTRRAQAKRELKSGEVMVHDLLLEPPAWMETMKVIDLLIAVPKYGRVKVNKMLLLVRVSPSKTVGGLSPRQRSELVASVHAFRPYGPQRRMSAR